MAYHEVFARGREKLNRWHLEVEFARNADAYAYAYAYIMQTLEHYVHLTLENDLTGCLYLFVIGPMLWRFNIFTVAQ